MRSTAQARGLRELVRDFGKVSKELKKELQREISEVTKVVSDEARAWASNRYGSAVGGKIRPRVRGASGIVESRATSKGIRPAFGSKVMRVLVVSAAKKEDEVVDKLEDMLDRIGRGFDRGTI